jgi:hypothetical protein
MPAAPLANTSPTEVDRKLHRVVIRSGQVQASSQGVLAASVRDGDYAEFTYRRGDETLFSSADSIRFYVSFARTVGLLGEDFRPAEDKRKYSGLGNFQEWLGENVTEHLVSNGCSPDAINRAVEHLLKQTPATVPTPGSLRKELGNPLPDRVFRLCLKIESLLRPKVLELASRRLVLVPGVLGE